MLGRRVVVVAALATAAVLLPASPAYAAAPDLDYTVTISQEPAVVGQPVTFTLRTVNDGDVSALQAQFLLRVEDFTEGADGVVLNPTPTCLHGQGDTYYNFQCLDPNGEQDPGEVLQGSFKIRFTHPGEYHLFGAALTIGDSDLSNNGFDHTIVVQPAPDPVTGLLALIQQTLAAILGLLV